MTHPASFLKWKNTEQQQKDTAHKRNMRNSNPKETIMVREAQQRGNV